MSVVVDLTLLCTLMGEFKKMLFREKVIDIGFTTS
jgi:hypothetical protein